MRRLALAAVLGSLVLGACSDQSQPTPTDPGASFKPAAPPLPYACSTSPWVLNDLADIFPGGNGKTLLSSAREKINAIIASCQAGREADAQTKAMFFDDWMFKKFQAKLLTTNPTLSDDVLALFIAVLQGVGLETSNIKPDLVTSDAGTGVFTPGTESTVFTALFFAALRVPANGFSETTLLIIGKLPNNTKLTNTSGLAQFPPFYDFNAINGSNQHVLNTDQFAHVEMCLYKDIDYPPGFAIGHNPVFGAPGYPFEVLEDDGLHLLNDCMGIPPEISWVRPGGIRGLAVSAWQMAKHGMRAMLLPQQLQATTMVVGSGSASGKTSSLSPFGIVGAATLEFAFTGDPSGQTVVQNSQVSWQNCELKGCFTAVPEVRVLGSQGSGLGGVEVTVTLLPVGSSSGTFGEGTTSVITDSETGNARFDELSITEPGTYKLQFSITGSTTSLTSGSFTVVAGGE